MKELRRCSPNCHKWLSKRTIRRHYKKADTDKILCPLSPSEFAPDSEDDFESTSGKLIANLDVPVEQLDEGILERELGSVDDEMGQAPRSTVKSGDLPVDQWVDESMVKDMSMMSLVEADVSNDVINSAAAAVGIDLDDHHRDGDPTQMANTSMGDYGDEDTSMREPEHDSSDYDTESSSLVHLDSFSDFAYEETEDQGNLATSQTTLLKELESFTFADAEMELHSLRK